MQELTEEALVAASVDDVWADFTRADRLQEWMWPPRFESTAAVDLRELGRWELRSDVAELAVEATILAVDAPRTLRLAWRWAGEDHSTDVELFLEPAADGSTRVIVRHSGFVSDEERASHVEGWSNCLQRLVDRYGGPPGEHL
ncbi:SRPBCC family protein [Microbacterium yannicii]|uniref:SRPBCC family protein n=1 Tax=Microbacterium yannicii TaxID=671622 RepID=UPI0002E6B586|nr:SRPBCC domain-containing protein [Microbacterium yannicii]